MGKSWQDDQGKLTPSLSCFMKAWQMCREQEREEAGEGKNRSIRAGDGRMEGVPSSRASVMALLCPTPPPGPCGVPGSRQD